MPLSVSRDFGPEVPSLQTSASVSPPEHCPWQWPDGQVSAWVPPSSHKRLSEGSFSGQDLACLCRQPHLAPSPQLAASVQLSEWEPLPSGQPLGLDEITRGSGCFPSLRLQTKNGEQQHAQCAVCCGWHGCVWASGEQMGQWRARPCRASPEMASALSTAPSPLPPLYLTYWENSHP